MSFVFDEKRWRKSVANSMAQDGISYRKLSEKTKISVSVLHGVINGKIDGRMGQIIGISNAVDICIVEFFDEDDYQLRLF